MKNIDALVGELESALSPVARSQPGVFTTAELAEAIGASNDTARRKIKLWYRAGLIEPTKKVVNDLAGRTIPVPAYRVTRTRKKAA